MSCESCVERQARNKSRSSRVELRSAENTAETTRGAGALWLHCLVMVWLGPCARLLVSSLVLLEGDGTFKRRALLEVIMGVFP